MLEFDAQGAHFGSTVDTEQFSPFPWRVIAQRLDRLEPRQRHESQQQKDGFETVKALGQSKVLAGIAQQAADQQRWQCQQDAAFGNIKGRRKPRRSLIKQPEAGRQPFQRRGGAASHRGGTIGFGARAFAARRRTLDERRSAVRRAGTIFNALTAVDARVYRGNLFRPFFLTSRLTRPARIAFSSVLRFNFSVSATSAALAPPARSCSASATTVSTSTAAPRVTRGA